MTKKIFVNYTGGYCGNFISSLLSDALKTKDVMGYDPSTNAYEFLSSGVHSKFIKPFGKLFQIHNKTLRREDLQKIAELNLDAFYIYVMKLYGILYDKDEDVFLQNVKDHYEDLLSTVDDDYFICSIHYAFQYKNLSIHDVFKDSTVLYLYTENKRYGRYFTLLLYHKTKNAPADQILQSTTLNFGGIYGDVIDPSLPVVKDPRSIPVDIGRITFEKDFEYLSEIEKKISESIGTEVKLDRQRLSDYADKNNAILESILGPDFMVQTEYKQLKASLDYIEKKVRI